MVSGSDRTARRSRCGPTGGVDPQDIVDRYHAEFLECWERLGITFDLYTTTGTENHREVT